LVFNANGDLAAAVGDNVVAQRIHTRIIIPLGSFIYNPNLGSRLRGTSLRAPMNKGAQEISAVIREALQPMDDIEISEINVVPSETDPTSMTAHIAYRPLSVPDDPNSATGEESLSVDLSDLDV
jgi:hypothetical protein